MLSRTGLVTPEQFRNIIIKIADGHQVKLGEVARVELGAADERRDSRYNGQPAITVGIIKQAVANPLDVSKAVRTVLPEINQSLPQGLSATIGNDSAVFIDRSIKAVYHTIGEAILLVVLVIIFFLRSMRASLIPIVTIPISLIATFTLLFAMGFTINTLTLLAMVLAIGLVVDDAIVVLENIYRRIEEGMTADSGRHRGHQGDRLCRHRHDADAGGGLRADRLRAGPHRAAVPGVRAGAGGRGAGVGLRGADADADDVLQAAQAQSEPRAHLQPPSSAASRPSSAATGAICRGRAARAHAGRLVAAVVVAALERTVLPGAAVRAGAGGGPRADPGARHRARRARRSPTHAATATRWARSSPRCPRSSSTLIINGSPEVSRFQATGRLTDWDERKRSQQQINAEINPKLRRIPGGSASASNPGSFGQRGSSRPVEFVIQTSGTYEQLQEYVDLMLERIRDYPGLESVETDLQLNMPEFRIDMDRAKVADLGLDVTVVGRTLETLLGGRQVTRFEQNGEQYDVIVQLAAEDRASPQTLSTIFLRSPAGDMVQLSNIVKVREAVAPKELKRFNQLRAVTISANLAPGYALGDGLAFLEKTAREVLPRDGADRRHRPEPRVPRGGPEPAAGVPAGAGVHLPGAGGAVRELPRPAASSWSRCRCR